MTDIDTAVSRLAAEMPSIWKTDEKLRRAQQIVTDNAVYEVDQGVRQLAFDAIPRSSLDRDINNFFRQRGDQMPDNRYFQGDQVAPSSGVASLPMSFSSNHTGGSEHARRNHGADQPEPYSAQAVVAWVTRCLNQCDDDQRNELLQGLADLLDAEMGTASDENGSTLRLPMGEGVGPHELLAPGQGSSTGTWGRRDDLGTGPRGNTDGRDSRSRQRRQAHDRRRPAQDAAINLAPFEARFPFVASVEIWNRR